MPAIIGEHAFDGALATAGITVVGILQNIDGAAQHLLLWASMLLVLLRLAIGTFQLYSWVRRLQRRISTKEEDKS